MDKKQNQGSNFAEKNPRGSNESSNDEKITKEDKYPPESAIVDDLICPSCKKNNPSHSQFCVYCGQALKLVKPDSSFKNMKMCIYCHKKYKSDVRFCVYCGKELTTVSDHQEQPSIGLDKISGYYVPISPKVNDRITNAPTIESFSPLTQLNITKKSLRVPRNAVSVNSTYFTATAKFRTNSVGNLSFRDTLSSQHLFSYFFVWIFVYIIYNYWFFFLFHRTFLTDLNTSITSNTFSAFLDLYLDDLTMAIFASLIVTFILLIPFVLLGAIATANDISMSYRIDVSLMFVVLIVNIVVSLFNFFIPFIMLPGETKLPELPPRNSLSRAISMGLLSGVIITIFTGVFLLLTPQALIQSDFVLQHALLVFLCGSWMLVVNLVPIGNVISKLVREWNSVLYVLAFLASVTCVFYAMTLIGN